MGDMQKNENAVRSECFEQILPILCEYYGVDREDIFAANNMIVLPALFPDKTETYVTITVSVPRGKRMIDDEGNPYYEPYDGEEAVQAYKDHLAEQKAKHERNAAKRAKPAMGKNEAKKVIKTMKKDIQEVLPTMATGQ